MKRSSVFVMVTGMVSLLANVLAIWAHFSTSDALARWQPDRGLLVVLTFFLMAYGLSTWAALTWRWTRAVEGEAQDRSRRPAALLLNALAAFPLLTLWLSLLFSVVFYVDLRPSDRWILAMGFAWGGTPFLALGLTAMGESLGPLLAKDGRDGPRV